jgi:hypothetical protein
VYDRIAVKKFAADSPAAEQMIRATLAIELNEAGLKVVDVDVAPAIIISGTITKVLASYEGDYVDSVFVIVSTSKGKFVMSLRFNQDYRDKTPGEIGTEIGKRIAKKIKISNKIKKE